MSTKVAILLSRQPLRPTAETPWIRQTLAAVTWLQQQGHTILSSTGMQTWDLITSVASDNGLSMQLYLPMSDDSGLRNISRDVFTNFDLDEETASIIPTLSDKTDFREKMAERDQLIVKDADILFPVSVRPDGTMQSLIAAQESLGKQIVNDFHTKYQRRTMPLKYSVDHEQLNPDIDQLSSKYLIHWTRAANSAWPDERIIDYWRAVTRSASYPRNAYETLHHILTTGFAIASTRHMPDNVATVSFSGLSVRDALPLMRWRSRYHEMSFEPYGFGIEIQTARFIGVMPVSYHNGHEPLTSETRWQSQSRGQKTDWRYEDEYRLRGDLNLRAIPREQLCAFCHRSEEALTLESETGIRTVSIMRPK